MPRVFAMQAFLGTQPGSKSLHTSAGDLWATDSKHLLLFLPIPLLPNSTFFDSHCGRQNSAPQMFQPGPWNCEYVTYMVCSSPGAALTKYSHEPHSDAPVSKGPHARIRVQWS